MVNILAMVFVDLKMQKVAERRKLNG
jgi:hypothetical protein